MKDTEIIQNNRLIAQFMSNGTTSANHNMYQKSWNELMPIVEKIKQDKELHKKHLSVMVTWEHRLKEAMFMSIDKLYKDIIEFIKWYNENK